MSDLQLKKLDVLSSRLESNESRTDQELTMMSMKQKQQQTMITELMESQVSVISNGLLHY